VALAPFHLGGSGGARQNKISFLPLIFSFPLLLLGDI
jgi:hypothetical protein